MNGISLKELRWFSAINDEFCESEAVSIWQAVLYLLPYFDDDASVTYIENIQRLEAEVYEYMDKKLDKQGELPLRDDNLSNYTPSYTEWDGMGNRLITEEKINAFLPELNRSRMLVLEHIEDADTIYQRLKLEIRNSRKNEHTKIELVEDTLRDDLERVLIKRTSLDAIFPDRLSCKKDKPVYWHDIKILIFYRLDLEPESKFSYMEFKVGQKILFKVERENSPFQGRKLTQPNKSFGIFEDFHKPLDKRKHDFLDKNYRKAITDLRKLLKKLTGISGDPFYRKPAKSEPYLPRFTVEFREVQSLDDDWDNDNKTVHFEDNVTGYTPDFDDEENNY
jgi:hypothetical protein